MTDTTSTGTRPLQALPLAALTRTDRDVEILRYLVNNPGSHFGQIHADNDLPMSSLRQLLLRAEESGVVKADIPTAARRGRANRYFVDTDVLAGLINQLHDDLLG